jgi:hypothetical protein
MGEEQFQSGAEVIMASIAIAREYEPVLRATAIAQ